MILNLREIIHIPGKSVPFDYTPDLSEVLEIGGVTGVLDGARAVGSVRNSAGVLLFEAELTAALEYTCARCLVKFTRPLKKTITATLAENVDEENEADVYPLDGDGIDIGEVLVTEVILGLDLRTLCSDDCKGICERCGASLNDGPCSCGKEIDPRLTVLGQLLENE